MKLISRIAIQLVVALFCCQTFGQVGPKLQLGDQIVDYDPKYTSEVEAPLRNVFLAPMRRQLAEAKLNGITRIGNLDLAKLEQDLNLVTFRKVNLPAIAFGVGDFMGRHGSVYFVETKTVFVNQYTLDNQIDKIAGLLPHEILGALGIDDRRSQVSVLLSDIKKNKDLILDLSKTQTFPKRLESTPQMRMQYFNSLKSKGGGVTVVGGGGDEIMHEMKTSIINHRKIYRDLIMRVVFEDKGNLRMAEQIAEVEFSKYWTEEVLLEYEKCFLEAPLETVEAEKVEHPGRLESIGNFHQIMYTARLDDINGQRQKFDGPYMRVSREHWNMTASDLSLDMTRHFYGMFIYLGLFQEWLKDVHLKK